MLILGDNIFYGAGLSALGKTDPSEVEPGARGELNITALDELHPKAGTLHVELFDQGYAWLDTGTHDALLQAAQFEQTTEERKTLKISCPDELCRSLRISHTQKRLEIAKGYGSSYADYLKWAAST